MYSNSSPVSRGEAVDSKIADVELYPFFVFAHWCTALGVSTESAVERCMCCNCCCGRNFERKVLRCQKESGSRGENGAYLADKSLCTADDVLHRCVLFSLVS
jgi:hypothetical protein